MAIDLATLRDRLDLSPAVVSDEELAEILTGCMEQQAARVLPVPSVALDRALIRRVAREVAAKGMPLGAAATEFGSFYIPSWSDPIVASLEADHLIGGFS